MAEDWLWKDVPKQEPVAKLSLLTGKSESSNQVTNSRVIASFCTVDLDKGSPLMLIPGYPSRYVRWPGGQLRQQREEMLVDENHFVNPRYPLESLIRAVEVCTNIKEKKDGKFDWQGVDIVTDRNNLRKIFSTLQSGIGDERSEPFRFDIERIGRTVMLTRVERLDKEFSQFPTYGKHFEQVCTKAVDSQFADASFRCVAEMQFANFRLLVRFEVDGADFASKAVPDPDDDLENQFSKMNLAKNDKKGDKFSEDSDLYYKQLPKFYNDCPDKLPVDGATLVELTTRAAHRGFPMEKWLQMYFSGTGKLVLGRHQRGRVSSVEEFTLSEVERQLTNGKPQAALDKLAAVLKQLVDFVRKQPDESLFTAIWRSQFDDSRESLRIYKRSDDATTRVAPPSLVEKLI